MPSLKRTAATPAAGESTKICMRRFRVAIGEPHLQCGKCGGSGLCKGCLGIGEIDLPPPGLAFASRPAPSDRCSVECIRCDGTGDCLDCADDMRDVFAIVHVDRPDRRIAFDSAGDAGVALQRLRELPTAIVERFWNIAAA